MRDDVLGYAPAKGKVATAEKYYDNQLIYRVRYTIGADGLRVPPPVPPEELGCVLFFGDSVTFGEGVADDQTMPYQVGTLTGNRYRIYNFALHGYGPHQMLAALESGRIDESRNFLSLQDQIEGTENRVAMERRNYNEFSRRYNTKLQTFPGNIVADMMGFEAKPYFEAETKALKGLEDPFGRRSES